MIYQRSLIASALLSAFSTAAFAQAELTALPPVLVTATPFGSAESAQILAPAKVLAGDELRDKIGSSLGETLSQELGVSSSAFGASASRPIIRGMEGGRVKILQNGMSVPDVSSLSNDHAVAAESSTAKQVEILRGSAALLYGSGAIGGLVNIVNDRIPTVLESIPTGEAELRFDSVSKSKSASVSADASFGKVGLHVDANLRNASDYKIPGYKVFNDPSSPSGTLPNSSGRQNSIGLGGALIENWGHIGASMGVLNNLYSNPTAEGSKIDLTQTRFDVDALIKKPMQGFESLKFKLGHTDYKHSELDLTDVPQVNFANQSLDSRLELAHQAIAGWRGTFGVQTEGSRFSALSASTGGIETVPITKSTSFAGFVAEERDFGPVRVNAGLRVESVKRKPDGAVDRAFNLTSYSVGGLWEFMPGYGFGSTLSIAQRAPTPEELYSSGPHEATGTFDIGNSNFAKESSRNIELTVQKTSGLVRWKANAFQTRFKNYVYGTLTGNLVDEDGNPGTDLAERVFAQANATIRGAEAEMSYNSRGQGLSGRIFADASRGSIDSNGSLPLQPAKRFVLDAGYRSGAWRSGLTVLRVRSQDRLASFETTPTAGYTQVDLNLSYKHSFKGQQLTWFAQVKNALNQAIRSSTSVLKDVAPQPGRNFVIGLRTLF